MLMFIMFRSCPWTVKSSLLRLSWVLSLLELLSFELARTFLTGMITFCFEMLDPCPGNVLASCCTWGVLFELRRLCLVPNFDFTLLYCSSWYGALVYVLILTGLSRPWVVGLTSKLPRSRFWKFCEACLLDLRLCRECALLDSWAAIAYASYICLL